MVTIESVIVHLTDGAYIIKSGYNAKRKSYKLMSKAYSSICYVSGSIFKRLFEHGAIKESKKDKSMFVICKSGIIKLRRNTKEKKSYYVKRNSIRSKRQVSNPDL